MTKPPEKDSDYSPVHAAQIDAAIESVSNRDVSGADPEAKLKALRHLIDALDRGFKIGYEHFVEGNAEPFPGAAAGVMRQCRQAIILARATGLIPHVER